MKNATQQNVIQFQHPFVGVKAILPFVINKACECACIRASICSGHILKAIPHVK